VISLFKKKVPVIMQMEMLECGAASLAMILAYHGKWIPLEKVRRDCGVSRDGSKASSIVKAARLYDLASKGSRGEIAKVKQAVMPCIIHWNFNHFVVLTGFSNKYAYINDPAQGAVKVPLDEFDKAFTGVYLTFEKTEAFKPEGKPKNIWEFAVKRLKGTLIPFIFIILTGMLTALFGIVNPVLSRVFLESVLGGGNPDWFIPLIIIMSSVAALSLVVGLVNAIYLYKIRAKLAIVASSAFLWHVIRLPMEFFSQRMAGDIAQRQASNENIAETLIKEIAPMLLNAALMVFYIAVMYGYSPLLTVIGVGSIMVNVILAAFISKKRVQIARVQMRDGGKLAGATVAGIEMIETIKAAGAENGFYERWSGYQASVQSGSVRTNNTNAYLGTLPEFVSALTSIIILVTGVYLIMQNRFSVGMLLAFQGFMLSLKQPVNQMITTGQTVSEMRVMMERVEDVLKYPADVSPDIQDELPAGFDKLTGNIEVRDVAFGYSPLAPPLIENVSFTLKPGSSVALVGMSGCGKSTLTKLVSGLNKPWAGEILFDGKPIDKIDRRIFTNSLAVVDQDITVFEDSVSENVKMWDKSIEDFEMIMACRDAGIHNDILSRPEGYAHKMIEGGRNFSGGQRQRIEIARTLASDPTILIMDEATSALDAKTEFDVTKAIKDRGITCIVIAHRLSTIRDCDEIIVLDKGKIVERGTHGELVTMNGYYTTLVTTA
jgi:NHLM bacteriocin system ABC transporter peptidase/ATP-binding protein